MLKYLYSLILVGSLASSVVARGQQLTPEALDKYAKEVDARGGQSLSTVLQDVVKQVYEPDNYIIYSTSDKLIHVSLLLLESSRLRTKNPAMRDKISALQAHLMTLYKKID